MLVAKFLVHEHQQRVAANFSPPLSPFIRYQGVCHCLPVTSRFPRFPCTLLEHFHVQGCKVATLDTTERVEFVLNNGANEWDSPYSGAKNYIVEGPGTWHLKSGKLQKLG